MTKLTILLTINKGKGLGVNKRQLKVGIFRSSSNRNKLYTLLNPDHKHNSEVVLFECQSTLLDLMSSNDSCSLAGLDPLPG